jgi:hypothetical protein
LFLASRSKIHQKGVPPHQTSSKRHPDGQQHHIGAPASLNDEKKSKKRGIFEVLKKTTSLTSKDSFKDAKKHSQKHVEKVMEPVAIAHLEMLKVRLRQRTSYFVIVFCPFFPFVVTQDI